MVRPRGLVGNGGIFLNSVGDVSLLPLVLDAARRFHEKPADAEIAAMLEGRLAEPLFV